MIPPEMSPQSVAAALSAREIILIDVREPGEYAAARIHGALLFPLSTFDAAMLPVGGPRPIVFHCGSGKRSAKAFARCEEAGIAVHAHMAGGIGAWKAAGLPIVEIDPETGMVRDSK